MGIKLISILFRENFSFTSRPVPLVLLALNHMLKVLLDESLTVNQTRQIILLIKN